MASALWVVLLVELLLVVNPGSSVAPGDKEVICNNLRSQGAAPIPAYSANMKVLMDSWNYQNLLPPRSEAVWDQVDNDTNNSPEITTNVSYFAVNCMLISAGLAGARVPICYTIYGYAYSGFNSPTLHANSLSKCVGSVLVHRITG